MRHCFAWLAHGRRKQKFIVNTMAHAVAMSTSHLYWFLSCTNWSQNNVMFRGPWPQMDL